MLKKILMLVVVFCKNYCLLLLHATGYVSAYETQQSGVLDRYKKTPIKSAHIVKLYVSCRMKKQVFTLLDV